VNRYKARMTYPLKLTGSRTDLSFNSDGDLPFNLNQTLPFNSSSVTSDSITNESVEIENLRKRDFSKSQEEREELPKEGRAERKETKLASQQASPQGPTAPSDGPSSFASPLRASPLFPPAGWAGSWGQS
jgi:hypothetical protein